MLTTLTEICQFRLKNYASNGTVVLSGTIIPSYKEEDFEKTIALLNDHPQIKGLELVSCELDDTHILLLAKQLKYIENITLRGNDITTAGFEAFLEVLQENKESHIKKIDLENANFSDGTEKTWDKIISLIPDRVIKLSLARNRVILGAVQDKVAAKIQENIAKLQTSKSVPPIASSSTLFKPAAASENQPVATIDNILEEVHQKRSELFSMLNKVPEKELSLVLEEIHRQLDDFRSAHAISPSRNSLSRLQ